MLGETKKTFRACLCHVPGPPVTLSQVVTSQVYGHSVTHPTWSLQTVNISVWLQIVQWELSWTSLGAITRASNLLCKFHPLWRDMISLLSASHWALQCHGWMGLMLHLWELRGASAVRAASQPAWHSVTGRGRVTQCHADQDQCYSCVLVSHHM